ncbi:penicillin-insensitive murein endopeptidase [Myxococcota bacterium]|nr:penicillin-insensitive murein endopeptidase [Myxococcota bacterium]MBU1898199.1 penicillin-insensitive murein endopeptidase [Myxococcota bacterium]
MTPLTLLLIFFTPPTSTMTLELLAFEGRAEAWASPLWQDQLDPRDARVRAAIEAERRSASDESSDESSDEISDEVEDDAPSVTPAKAAPPVSARSEAERLCVSIGQPNRGWLVNGVKLTDTDHIISRRRNAYGAPEMVGAIKRGAAAVFARFPSSPRLVVGDLSKPDGGPFPPHKSHQSGRDADIGYFLKGAAPERLERISARRLDPARTWIFLKALLQDPKVDIEYMFITYDLQKALYNYAKNIDKVSEEDLSRWFSYPRGKKSHAGIIRHLKGHNTHVHVRFHTPIAVSNLKAYIKKHGNKAIKPLPVYYKIRRGDNLSKIARRHKARIKDITQWNRIKKRKLLRPGDKLIVGWRRPSLPR